MNYPIDFFQSSRYIIYVLHILFSFLVAGCENVTLVSNGFCNDETNNAYCKYDGGDCCVVNANTNSCSECVCHLIETCAAGYHPLVGNGFCNDDTNIAECDYDGGDCCGPAVSCTYIFLIFEINLMTSFCKYHSEKVIPSVAQWPSYYIVPF